MESVFYYDYPVGRIGIAARDGFITHVFYAAVRSHEGYSRGEIPLIAQAAAQLREYFSGRRKEFELPLMPQGTTFQQSVWKALTTIPYGETLSYQEVAALVGNPKASRAVGMANHRNPIAIIIPCHRVNGADGKLRGYAGGLPAKQYLLDLEKSDNR
jgi:methylated-DNA-[protein]-cysteine S-methyltransferase